MPELYNAPPITRSQVVAACTALGLDAGRVADLRIVNGAAFWTEVGSHLDLTDGRVVVEAGAVPSRRTVARIVEDEEATPCPTN